MSCILHIETSTKVCSVAVSQDGACIYDQADLEGPNHAVKCGVFVDEALSFAESHAIPLDAVAVSEGPGSYTGLRIGYSMAKGVCFGRNVPLISLPTLEVMCVPVLLYHEEIEDDALLVPMIDARRMEVYTAAYDKALATLLEPQAMILDCDSFSSIFAEHKQVAFVGNAVEKAQQVIRHPHALFIGGIKPVALDMMALSERAFRRSEFIDVAYSTPLYLKEFQATKPKKNIL